VSALFCDLVDSTGIGERLDAEPLRRMLDEFFQEMSASIIRHGGTVEKFIGDAVVGTFGIPTSHEDDALRAVRAALEMVRKVSELKGPAPVDAELRVRVTISSGEVYADEGSAMSGSVGGDVFNIAARLQSSTPANEVVVSEFTERLIRGRVDLAPLGATQLRGKSSPVDAFRVLGVRTSTTGMATPFVGRDRQLSVLRDALDEVEESQSSVLVTVLSPPGVGKSRLAEEFIASMRRDVSVAVGQTPSYGEGVTFAPLVELLAQVAEDSPGDARKVATRLAERLSVVPDGSAVAGRLAQILGVGEAHGSDASWAVRRLFEVVAADRPLVVVLEDLHWAEAPMLDLIDAVFERLHGPVLMLCLARPELLERRPTWGAGKLRAITISLGPLPPDVAQRLATALLGDGLPTSVLERVCAAAEGNPLYLEQLTAMLSDQGYLAEGGWGGLVESDLDVPATLQTLLAARLDRLDNDVRRVLERAAIEGRRFRMPPLIALTPELTPATIDMAIAELDRRELIEPEDEARGSWRFAHMLVREAAYRGVSKEVRSQLHESLATWMDQNDRDQTDVDEMVGRHLESALRLHEELGPADERAADLALRAGEHLASAGERALSAIDLLTARDLLGRAAALLPECSATRLNLLPNLGVTLSETGRPSETDALLTRGIAQAQEAGLEREALRAIVQLQSNRVYRSPTEEEIHHALIDARTATDALSAMGDDVGCAEGAIAIEYLEMVLGHVAEAGTWALRGLVHALKVRHAREAAQAAADWVNDAIVGPLRVDRFSDVATALPIEEGSPVPEASREMLYAAAALALGDRDRSSEHEARWRGVIECNGLTWLGATHDLALAQLEFSIGRPELAERRLRDARATLAGYGDIWWCDTADTQLCLAIAAQDRKGEFLRFADDLTQRFVVPDRQALIRRHTISALAAMARESPADAEPEAARSVELTATTDLLLDRATALLVHAQVAAALGRNDEAKRIKGEVDDLYESKAITAGVALVCGNDQIESS
jgi:class 3 adenylate cyclase